MSFGFWSRCLERKPPKVKLDLLEVENRGAQVSSWSLWIRGLRLETKFRDSCWMDQSKEEFSFAPSVAARESAGWHEPKFRCHGQCHKGDFEFYDTASMMMGGDGEQRATSLCLVKCFYFKAIRMKRISGKWSAMEAFSRWSEHVDFENKMCKCWAAKKMFAKSLLEGATTALKLGKRWPEESPFNEALALLR